MEVALQSGLDGVVRRYAGFGPLAASFLANLLATFGDKGQLVVVTLASRYDAKKVFAGSMAAFGLWSAVEVLFGRWILSVVPGAVVGFVTGGLFLAFGLWSLRSAVGALRGDASSGSALVTSGGVDVGVPGALLPDRLLGRVGRHGGILVSFLFILFAEFGDKTQLLTINLAATFPDAPLPVFVGVVAALGLRTGVDALIGERVERRLPTAWIELVAAAVFCWFGLVVFGVAPVVALGVVALPAAAVVVVLRRCE